MTGNISNARPGPCEATRYTYLYFGGLGVAFQAKDETVFVRLTADPSDLQPKQLKLMADSKPGEEHPPFFMNEGDEDVEHLYSLCFPLRRPRYWYSGQEVKEEKLVYVYNVSPFFCKVVYRGEVVYSSSSTQILSAAIFNDPLEGDCLYVVSVGAWTEYYGVGGGYIEMILGFPFTGTVIKLKNKVQVRSWVKRASDFPAQCLGGAIGGSGFHTLDGTKFVHVLPRFDPATGIETTMVFSIDSNGDMTQEEIPTEQEVRSQPGSYSYTENYSSIPPNPHDWENYSSTLFREMVETSEDKTYTSMLISREALHDGTFLDIRVENSHDYSRTAQFSKEGTKTFTQVIVFNTPGNPLNGWTVVSSFTANSGNLNGVEQIDYEKTTKVKLWDEVSITTLSETRTSITTHNETTNQTETRVYGINPAVSWQIDTTRDYAYTHTVTDTVIRREVEAWCPHSKSVLMRCTSQATTVTATRAGTIHTVDTEYGLDFRPEEAETEVITTKEDKIWIELLVGSQVTKLLEIEVNPPRYDYVAGPSLDSPPWTLSFYDFNAGAMGINRSVSSQSEVNQTLPYIDPVRLGVSNIVISGAGYDWAVNRLFNAKYAHMIGLNGKSFIAAPLYYYGSNYPSPEDFVVRKVPDPGDWVVRISPTIAEEATVLELSSPSNRFTSVSSVYPTE